MRFVSCLTSADAFTTFEVKVDVVLIAHISRPVINEKSPPLFFECAFPMFVPSVSW